MAHNVWRYVLFCGGGACEAMAQFLQIAALFENFHFEQ
jgi:hypothetical protein